MSAAGYAALTRFVAKLRRLRQEAGSPSLNTLVVLTAGLERPLRRSTIADKLHARTFPEWDFVVSFVTACKVHAEDLGRPLPAALVDLTKWDADHWRMVQAVDRAQAGERLRAAAGSEIERRADRAPIVDTPTTPGEVSGRPVTPHQLPATVRHFVGRTAELTLLGRLVDEATGPGNALVILAVEGTAGIGKTTLVLHAAHRIAGRFPGGQLYVDLRGFNPTHPAVSPASVLHGFLEALGVVPEQIPADAEARAARYRSLLADRPALVVLDNAADVEQIRPLLPGTPGSLVMVTSRRQLIGLVASHEAHSLTLGLLSRTESRELLESRLDNDRLAAQPDAVDEIISYCAGLPLALGIVAARAALYPGHPLSRLAEELRDAAGRLDAFDGGGPATDVRSVFSWSYGKLHPAAARLFRLLGLHPGADVTVAAAASLAGGTVPQVHGQLTELTRAHLVTEHQPNRYTFHDLLRTYAVELTGNHDGYADLRAATARLLDHYLHTAYAASLLLNPGGQDTIVLPPRQVGASVVDLYDRDQALAWFAEEREAIVGAVGQAAGAGFDTHAYQLAWTLYVFLTRQGRWSELAATQRIGLAAAQRLGDLGAQARAHRAAGLAEVELGRYGQASDHLRHALELLVELNDAVGQAQTHLGFSRVLDLQGRHRDALAHAEQAHDLYRFAGNPVGQANALNSIGWSHILIGEHRHALAACRRALALVQPTGDRWVEAATWDSLGYAYHHLGDHQHAATCYLRAAELCRGLGDLANEANTLIHLGDTRCDAGDIDGARIAWRQALVILNELSHPDTAEILAKLRQAENQVSRHSGGGPGQPSPES